MGTPRNEGFLCITQPIWDPELGSLSSPSCVNAFATTYLGTVLVIYQMFMEHPALLNAMAGLFLNPV